MIQSEIFNNDISKIIQCSFIDWDRFKNKTFFITGATGLIGTLLVNSLVEANKELGLNIHIFALVRNTEKAKKRLSEDKCFKIINGDVMDVPEIKDNIDYIIHAASITSSKAFINTPVEVSKTNFIGTLNLLNLAAEKKVASFIYLSTMEVYGSPATSEQITEKHGTNLDTMSVRSCYPESKRLTENLCASFASEYSVPAKVLCLTQTFGPGVEYDDGRVFAEFARCSIEGKDIVLHTKGLTKRNYLYTADSVTAILSVLVSGKSGEKYNVANEDTYCSIFDMANFVIDNFGNGNKVIVEEEDTSKFGYAPTLQMNLCCDKLKGLGWVAQTSFYDMYKNLIEYMKEIR